MLIALEGIDGAGTTTQVGMLAEALRRQGHAVHETAEPSGGPIGKLLRQALLGNERLDELALALLFAADRADHLTREVRPALGRGEVVVSDRYLLSSLAYQSLALPQDFVRAINARARRPELSILLRIDPDVAAARRAARGGQVELFDALDTQRAIAHAYDEVASLPDIGRVAVVDGSESREQVAAAIWQAVSSQVAFRTGVLNPSR